MIMEIQEAITLIESHGFTVTPVNTEGLELWNVEKDGVSHDISKVHMIETGQYYAEGNKPAVGPHYSELATGA